MYNKLESNGKGPDVNPDLKFPTPSVAEHNKLSSVMIQI